MTFSVNGIKQEKEEKYKVEILVCVDAPLLARKILEQNKILILSLKEYDTDPKTFGDIFFSIHLNFQEIIIVTKYEDIQEACTFFMFVGFDIMDINSYSKPLPAKKIDVIIEQSTLEVLKRKEDIDDELQKKEEQEKKFYQDSNLEAAKKNIFRVFEKIDEMNKRSAGTISVQDMKKIKSLTEDLRKFSLGTNLEKIRDTIEDLFAIIERVNAAWYESIQNTGKRVLSDSLVNSVDVEREIERMENIKILKSFGAKISAKNKDYSRLGSSAIFWSFFQKDFLFKVSDPSMLLYNAYDILEFVLVVVVSLLGVYTIANELYLFSASQYGLSFSLLTIGIRGSVVFVARQMRKKSLANLVLLILLAVILHYILMWIITTNFAL